MAFLRWRKRKKQPGTSWKKALSSLTVIQIYNSQTLMYHPDILYVWPPTFFLFIRLSHLFVLHSSSSTLVREYTKRICFLGGWATIYWHKRSCRVCSLSILELIFCHALCDISSIMSTGIQMTKICLALDLLNGQLYFLYWTVKDFVLFKHRPCWTKQENIWF